MALVIDLKPEEKVLVGTAVITNDKQRTKLHIAGDAPILREKDVLFEEDADTACKQIYFIIQCMYLARNPREYHSKYFALIKQVLQAAPSTSPLFVQINADIIKGHYYKALKRAQNLIEHENAIINASVEAV